MMNKLLTAVAVISLAACGNPGSGGGATLKGRTTDDTGTQQQGLTSDQLGGSGSVAATAKVKANKLKADGTLEVVGEAEVTSGGHYELKVPAGEKKLIVQSVDSTGKVRASVIVEKAGAEGEATVVSPMTTESSVEAEVLAQMLANGVTLAEANAIDLRARINAKTAEAVKSSADATVRVKALAEACAAAQRAQLKAWADVGVTTTQSALFDAQLAASVKLNAGLDAAADLAAAEKAYEEFVVALQAQAKASAGDAKKASKGERAAGIAFRATVSTRLRVSGQAADPVADAAVRHAASLEARAATAATDAALTAGAAATATMDSFHTASATLITSLRASTSATATAAAYATYHTSLVGSANVMGSILGNYLQVNAATAASVDAAVMATATAAAQLDTALSAAATASITASQAIDFDAYANAVATALKTFDAAAQAQAASLVSFGSKADVAVELMAQANGSLRVTN